MQQCPPGSEFVVLASSLAIALSEKLNADEMNLLSNFFNALGDNLAILAAQRAACGKPDQRCE